jgi:GrpB-like predicted nucleotidyltransferase (UPF0157 family)
MLRMMTSTPKAAFSFHLIPYSPDWSNQFIDERARIMRAWENAGALVHCLPLGKHAEFVCNEHEPNGVVHIGSTSIRNIELASPYHDMAILVDADPFSLPKIHAAMHAAGYTPRGVAPHAPNGQDMWWIRVCPPDRQAEEGYGFDLHIISTAQLPWLGSVLRFCRYLEVNDSARSRYVASKTPYKAQLDADHAGSQSKAMAYKMGKGRLVPGLFKEAQAWSESESRGKTD